MLRQRHFSVELKSVATKFSLSRPGWPFGVATQSFGVATGPGWLGVVAIESARIARQSAQHVRQSAHRAHPACAT